MDFDGILAEPAWFWPSCTGRRQRNLSQDQALTVAGSGAWTLSGGEGQLDLPPAGLSGVKLLVGVDRADQLLRLRHQIAWVEGLGAHALGQPRDVLSAAAVRSRHGDDTRCPDAMPGQSEHKRVELLTRHHQLRAQARVGPEEAALVQPTRAQPDADAMCTRTFMRLARRLASG